MVSAFSIKSEQEIVFEAYKEFDPLNRGYISAAAFRSVVGGMLPHCKEDISQGLFSAADMYQMEKVSGLVME